MKIMRNTQDLMMTYQAENCEYFNIGSRIRIVDCHKEEYTGTVRSFDYSTKILSIESPSPLVPHLSDIYLFNLDYVEHIDVLEEKKEAPEPLPIISVSKISQRLQEQEKERIKQKTYIGIGVSPEGQRLMNTISKTISECRWHNQDIVILGEVTIKPPYGPKDIHCVEGSKALAHISKIVEKHYDEEAKQARLLPSQR